MDNIQINENSGADTTMTSEPATAVHDNGNGHNGDQAPVVEHTNAADGATAAPQAAAPAASAPEAAAAEAAVPQAVASEAAAPQVSATEAPPAETGATSAPSVEAPPAPRAEPRSTRQPSMAQVMESDEFSSYMSGVDALSRGALMRGTVVRVDDNTGEALVDIGTKSEGIIERNEIGDDEIKVGDEIEVVVVRPENDEGHPVVSKRRADYEKTWREMYEAKEKQTNIEGTVRDQVKGGLIIDLGIQAFIPASHVDSRHRGDLGRFVGRTIPVRVIEIDRKRNKVIASHRLAAEEDRKAREEQAWATLQKDKIVEGVVRRITDFGAFVDIGGVDGLLHVREMSWGRVEHPEHVVKKGQKLQVLVLDIDRETKRIALGLKQLQSDPWKKAAKNLQPGQMVTGKIVRIAPSCAFMELEDGVEGIIPISEMSEQRIKSPEEVVQVGQEVEARIKQIQANQRRITLSLRAAIADRERRETRTAVREVNERASGGGDDALRLGDVFGQQLRAARDRGRERNEARAQARARAEEAADLEEWDVEEEGGEEATEAGVANASAATEGQETAPVAEAAREPGDAEPASAEPAAAAAEPETAPSAASS